MCAWEGEGSERARAGWLVRSGGGGAGIKNLRWLQPGVNLLGGSVAVQTLLLSYPLLLLFFFQSFSFSTLFPFLTQRTQLPHLLLCPLPLHLHLSFLSPLSSHTFLICSSYLLLLRFLLLITLPLSPLSLWTTKPFFPLLRLHLSGVFLPVISIFFPLLLLLSQSSSPLYFQRSFPPLHRGRTRHFFIGILLILALLSFSFYLELLFILFSVSLFNFLSYWLHS